MGVGRHVPAALLLTQTPCIPYPAHVRKGLLAKTEQECGLTERLLAGWKRIAQFIDVCVDTARKYHKLYGMPVLRGPGGTRYGIPEDIVAWLRGFNKIKKEFGLEEVKRPLRFDRDTGRFVRKTRRH